MGRRAFSANVLTTLVIVLAAILILFVTAPFWAGTPAATRALPGPSGHYRA